MTAPLTAGELRALHEIEQQLRLADPGLDRVLGTWNTARRLAWHPKVLVLMVGLSTLAAAACALWAAAGTHTAAVPAAAATAVLAAVFRRLGRLNRP
ncbi:DUF3040 domain-containing protein [Kitasatospora sp. NPDC085895]|uniref:DUF3040 domain-containing protein n=1 Tax=Kitasatospora sp. NPDC085895 TaxID=3155057 RepID=UPI0034507596